jgi:RNA polymerase sigma-70 factor (ECF subfamily)
MGLVRGRETDATWAISLDPDLCRALGRLAFDGRAAVVVTTLDGYSQDEVAAMFSVPRGTVSSWISRGRAQLRLTLGAGR